MEKTIKLSIQEIVNDFEKLVRFDERLDVLFDCKKANSNKIEEFYDFVLEMVEKYIPNYENHVDGNVHEVNYENALKLYGMLYENFKEILYQLV